MSETIERHEFGAEVGRLLDLVVHALYSDREIFLRELVANAADAIDRRRFASLTQPGIALPPDASVRIVPDKEARTLTLADPGIGMDRAALGENLGTIARSGTRLFGQSLENAKPEERPSLIGQFGVGFYSAFMVADRVEVTSRAAGSGGGLAVGVRREGGLHDRARHPRRARYYHRAAHEGGCGRVPGAVQAGNHRPQMGGPHHRADHGGAGRQGRGGERGHGAVAQAEVRGHRGAVRRVLPPPRPYVRRALGHAALAGGGGAGIHRAVVRAVLQAVRLHGRGAAGKPGAPARPPHVHHGRGEPAASLAALRDRRG